MAIKRVFNIKDENYNETFQLFGQHGYYEHDNIHMFDTCAMAQDCIENVAEEKDGFIYKVDKDLLYDNIKSTIEDISHKLIQEVFEFALSDIDDDEELELIKEKNIKITVEEYIKNNNFNYYLYDGWTTFAPSFNFKLSDDDWYEVFADLLEGTYELNRTYSTNVEDECITVMSEIDCFYGTGIIETTLDSLNYILKENNINIKYEFDYEFKKVIEKER